MFCDIPNDYHTTGYVDGNRLVLFDVAMKLITVEGDVLTVIDAGSDGTDLPFTRQRRPTRSPRLANSERGFAAPPHPVLRLPRAVEQVARRECASAADTRPGDTAHAAP